MSQKRQVKKVLPFTVLPKWRIGSSLTRSCIFKECLRVVLECLKTSGNICWLNVCFFLVFGCLEGCFNLSGWYFGMPELLGGVRGCFWRPTPWGIQWDWSQLTNVVQPWKTRFFSPDAFQTSKYPPQNPQKDTLGSRIGPRKVICGHFAFFWYFGLVFRV